MNCGPTAVSECSSFLEMALGWAIRADGEGKVKPAPFAKCAKGLWHSARKKTSAFCAVMSQIHPDDLRAYLVLGHNHLYIIGTQARGGASFDGKAKAA